MTKKSDKVDEVKICLNASELIIDMSLAKYNENDKYAFYIFINKEKTDVLWYSNKTSLTFLLKQSGIYNVVGFVKTMDEKIRMIQSNEVIYFNPTDRIDMNNIPTPLQRGAYLFNTPNFTFHTLFFRGEKNHLTVLLTAAINLETMSPPVFNRWRWADRFPGSVLCVSDPTLMSSDRLRLGWYFGTQEHDAMQELSQLVCAIAARHNIPNSNIAFYGSSGGGFAALSLAASIERSTAVAVNAQTIVTRFDLPGYVDDFLDCCLGSMCADEALAHYPNRLSVIDKLRATNSHIIMVNNTLDTNHWNDHYPPLKDVLGLLETTGYSTDGNHYSFIFNDPRGHVSEPTEMVDAIIAKMVEFSTL